MGRAVRTAEEEAKKSVETVVALPTVSGSPLPSPEKEAPTPVQDMVKQKQVDVVTTEAALTSEVAEKTTVKQVHDTQTETSTSPAQGTQSTAQPTQTPQESWVFPEPAVPYGQEVSPPATNLAPAPAEAVQVVPCPEAPAPSGGLGGTEATGLPAVTQSVNAAVAVAVAGIEVYKTVPALGANVTTLADLRGTVQVSETRMSAEERTAVMDAVLSALLEVREVSRLQDTVGATLATTTGKNGWTVVVADTYPDLNAAGVTQFLTFQIADTHFAVFLPTDQDLPGAGTARVSMDKTTDATLTTRQSVTDAPTAGMDRTTSTTSTALSAQVSHEAAATAPAPAPAPAPTPGSSPAPALAAPAPALDTSVPEAAVATAPAPAPAPVSRELPSAVPTSRDMSCSKPGASADQPKRHGWGWRQWFTSVSDSVVGVNSGSSNSSGGGDVAAMTSGGALAAAVAHIAASSSISAAVKDRTVEQLRAATELGTSKGTSAAEAQAVVGAITTTIGAASSTDAVVAAASDKLEQETGQSGWHLVIADDRYADVDAVPDVVAFQTLQVGGQYYTVYRTVTIVTNEVRKELVESLRSPSVVTKSTLSDKSTKTVVDTLTSTVESATSAEEIGSLASTTLESVTGKTGWHVVPAFAVPVDTLTEYTELSTCRSANAAAWTLTATAILT